MDHDDDTPDADFESGPSAFYRPRGRRKSVWQRSGFTSDAFVLDALDPTAVLDSHAQDLLLHGLRRLSDMRPTWFGEYRFHGSPKPMSKISLDGLMGVAPLAAAIIDLAMHVGDGDSAAVACTAAVASIVLATPTLLSRTSDLNALVEGGRGLRILRGCDDAFAEPLLRAPTPDDVLEVMAALDADPAAVQDENYLRRRYLAALARGLRAPPIEPEAPSPPPPRTATIVDEPIPEPVRPSASHATEELVAERHDRSEARQLRALAGVHGVKDTSEKLSVLGRALPGSQRVAHPAARRVLDTNETRAARVSGQDLAVAKPNVLTAGSVSSLGHSLVTAAPAPNQTPALALIFGSVYSGLAAWKLVGCPVFSEPPSEPPVGPYLCRLPFGVFLPSVLTRGLTPPKANPELYRVPATHSFVPWSHAMAGGQLLADHMALVPECEAFGNVGDVRRARAILRRHGVATGNPVTLRRLPRVLRDALGIVGVGPFETALLLGLPGRAAHGSARNYFAPTRQRMAELGGKGVALVSNWLGIAFAFDAIGPIEGFLGCWRCPTDSAARDWIKNVLALDTCAPPGRPSREKVLARQRRMQAVVYEVVSWETGVRPGPDSLDGLLHADRWLHVDEKKKPGARQRSACRAIPLSPTLRALLQAWREMRHHIRGQLGLDSEPAAFFVVDEDCVWRKATLKEIRAPLPTRRLVRNANRMYFATALEHHGAGHANLHRWVGHWGLGSEPGMPGGSQAPAHLSESDAAALVAFIASLGITRG